jgi:hypothetical protein
MERDEWENVPAPPRQVPSPWGEEPLGEHSCTRALKQTSQVMRDAETRDEVDFWRAESWFQKHRLGKVDPGVDLSTNRLAGRNFRQCFICGPRSRRSTRLDKGDLSNTEEKGSISKFFSANFLASTDRNSQHCLTSHSFVPPLSQQTWVLKQFPRPRPTARQLTR